MLAPGALYRSGGIFKTDVMWCFIFKSKKCYKKFERIKFCYFMVGPFQTLIELKFIRSLWSRFQCKQTLTAAHWFIGWQQDRYCCIDSRFTPHRSSFENRTHSELSIYTPRCSTGVSRVGLVFFPNGLFTMQLVSHGYTPWSKLRLIF